ncbi:MAG: response regulator [Armatimonadetes bacterium]|nr:response regulator [Armatimonadota bacterium]
MGKKILVIDDNVEFTVMIELILKSFGFEPIIALNGKEGLKKVELEKPDLALLDIMMPGIDGFEVLLKIKSHPEYKNIPVIMLTAKTDDSDKKKAFDFGANDYITKPFKSMILKQKIENFLIK